MGSAKRRNKRSTPLATWMAGNRARSRADAHGRDAARGTRDTHLVEGTDRREKDDGRRWNRKRSPRVSTGVRVRPQPHTGTENAGESASIRARATYRERGRGAITARAPGRAGPCPRMGT